MRYAYILLSGRNFINGRTVSTMEHRNKIVTRKRTYIPTSARQNKDNNTKLKLFNR